MGWHSFRIAYFNGEKPNFAKAVNVWLWEITKILNPHMIR
jgi:hypothetical protein